MLNFNAKIRQICEVYKFGVGGIGLVIGSMVALMQAALPIGVCALLGDVLFFNEG